MASRIDDLRKRLEKDPGSRLFAQLAEELRKGGELDEAIEVCRAGLGKHPAYPSAHMTLGRALFDKGELADARTELELVLKGAADNILASRMLGECLEGLGDVPAAIAQYKKTLILAPGEPHVVEQLANLEAGGEPSKPMVAAPPAPEPAPAEVGEAAPAAAGGAQTPEDAPAPAAADESESAAAAPPSAPDPAPASAPDPPEAPAHRAPPPAPAAKEATAVPEAAPTHATPSEASPAPAPPAPPAPVTKQAAAARAVTRPGMTGKFQAQNVVAAALAAKKAKEQPEDGPGEPVEEKKAADIPTIAQKPKVRRPGVPPEAATPKAAEDRFPGMGDEESSLVGIHVGDLSAPHEAGNAESASAPDEPASDEPPAEIVSATLAELHVEQGHLAEAQAMYRKLLEREPDNEAARRRLAELEAPTPAAAAPADRKTVVRRQIAALERMLEGVRRA